MSQQPPWQPQQQPNDQPQWGQQTPPYLQSLYDQPTQPTPGQFQRPPFHYYPLRGKQSGIWQWYKSRTKKVKLSIGCGMILAVLLFFSCIGTAVGSVNLTTQSPPTLTTPTHQSAILVSPAATFVPTPTPTPSATPTIVTTPTTQPTQPPPTPTPCPGVNCNPWGYNLSSPGNYIYSPPSAFCSYFTCINNFPHGHGYVVECKDSMYSKSGGIKGACSTHGGVLRPLYAH